MQPTMREIEQVAESFEALKYFPTSAGAKSAVIGIMRAMVSTTEQLDWLLDTMLNRVGEWPGTAELRAVFCTRFKPRDGIEASSWIPGFTALESEAQCMIEASDRKQKELAAPHISLGVALIKAQEGVS